MSEFSGEATPETGQTVEQFLATISRAANVESAFGPSRTTGEHTVIPVAEVFCGMGLGMGGGRDQTGAGGHGSGSGGGASTRPIAAVVVGPAGVEVKPVYDLTKLWLAALTTAAFVLPWLARLRAGAKAGQDENPARGLRRLRRTCC